MERSLPSNFIADQRNFWTSPLRLRVDDANWLLPAALGSMFVTLSDTAIERKLPTGANFIRQSKSFSNYGAAAYAGLVGGAYLWSRATNNDHLRETAVLSGEAAIDTTLVGEAVKYIAGRQRPLEGDGTGTFRSGGSSFPSLHTADAFAIASVVAHEYPGPLTQLLAYGGAAAIGAARVTGRQHFASDVLVGGALGWFMGRQVYKAHSDQMDRELYGTFERAPRERGPRDPESMGSAFVPLDSWIYPAIDRLNAMGYVQTAFVGLRPWTRIQVADLVDEASGLLREAGDNASPEADRIVGALRREFSAEQGLLEGASNNGLQLESIYTRFTGISGTPLADDYHFGETLYNDYGRPYYAGANLISGFSARGSAGPLSIYIRGEYQHAPAQPSFSPGVLQAMSVNDNDGSPAYTSTAVPTTNRFRLLDAYVGFTFSGNEVSFGKQSLWWGPDRGGPLLMSTNAEPIPMLRYSRLKPFQLPWPFHWMGPIRTEAFLGQLDGQKFIRIGAGLPFLIAEPQPFRPQPYITGQKLSFKPTPNFEFSVSKTSVFGGFSRPFTLKALYDNWFSLQNSPTVKPGDRRSAVDFTYRIPKLRRWLMLYDDSFTEDEYSPLAYPRRSAHEVGLYMPQVPYLPKLQLRTEGVYTDLPNFYNGGRYYWDTVWRSGYTNYNQILGNWVGRQGRGLQAWATYSFSPQNTVELNWRKQSVDPGFLEGGTLRDLGATVNWNLRSDLSLHSALTYERWNFPLLSTSKQSNVEFSFQLTFWPRWKIGGNTASHATADNPGPGAHVPAIGQN